VKNTLTGAGWAAIFDWDGVVVDSSRCHERAWERLAEELHRPLPDGFFRPSFGMKNERVMVELLGWSRRAATLRRLSLRKEVLFRKEVRRRGATVLPGTRAWLEFLRAAGIACAVGSSTPLANIRCVGRMIGLESWFDAIVSAEDVKHGKPDHEVFLKAARRLGYRPERCVVFEDAHVGMAAARAAGMRVVAVATTHPARSLREADLVVERLDRLSVTRISRWFKAARAPQ
jgi:beta-phosphoglucomutase family hydrolase